DLLCHVEQSPINQGVFASTMGANDFDELRLHAKDKTMLADRLARSGKLDSEFKAHILPHCSGDAERAREFLLRARTHAIDEFQLRERLDFVIRMLFYRADGA